MPTIPSLPALRVDGGWQTAGESWTRFAGSLRLRREDDSEAAVRVERCAAGQLREAYPVGAHDVGVRVTVALPTETLAELLGVLVRAITAADPHCRRMVHAVDEGDQRAIAAAEAAGFRYVVDVDLPDEQLSLLVYEPDWAAAADVDLERIPGT